MNSKELRGLLEAYCEVYAPQQIDEARTDPRGRPASGPMSVYGGKGKDAGPGHSGDERTDKMDRAQRRVMSTQPAKKGMAASRLHTLYSWRRKGSSAGSEEGPGPKSPKRGGRTGRGAETDRGKGNAAKRRMSAEEFDIFDTILEFLYVEGYAETLEEAEWMMANELDAEDIDAILDEAEIMKHQQERDRIEGSKAREADRVKKARSAYGKLSQYSPPTKGKHGEIERRQAQRPPSRLRSGSLPN